MKGKNHMKPRKELKELNLLDRFLFSEAADDPEFMEDLLGIIFDEEIQLLYPPQTEKEQRSTVSQKQIRLDVWAMDENDVVYDTEPQQKNTYNLPKRSRYYQGLIDSNLLKSGDLNYNALNDVYMIMIMPFDLFGKKLYRYTFRMSCEEDPNIELTDGAVRIFLNTRGTNPQNINPELVQLLHYFENTTDEAAQQSGSFRINRIHEKINAIKSSEEMGVRYMQAWEEKMLERQEGFLDGQSRGISIGNFEMLSKLVQKGIFSLEQAAEQAETQKEEFLEWYSRSNAVDTSG